MLLEGGTRSHSIERMIAGTPTSQTSSNFTAVSTRDVRAAMSHRKAFHADAAADRPRCPRPGSPDLWGPARQAQPRRDMSAPTARPIAAAIATNVQGFARA